MKLISPKQLYEERLKNFRNEFYYLGDDFEVNPKWLKAKEELENDPIYKKAQDKIFYDFNPKLKEKLNGK